ncbi:Bug family tripartite tricarboxylate transporter substrate binding protein [Diaphorobacter caeni]|uniref:Bug family tripartite tricarboxylate transporter substrate binding protein n=1 Tax=Diaphorobacter caeni TaxID=2784387 RepID=UPI00188F7C86|nr:tripartite tricarboxylate transporter substrate binding protein [Diaphorobacter caeni]MBF5007014.1 tripartite tricarboxylate transporter substrate binding protein [Diaphorobacter caeni]
MSLKFYVCAALAAFSLSAFSQNATEHYVEKIVIPYSAGGITDLYGRLLASKLSVIQGKPVIADNKPGGGASIGSASVANGPADGKTILLGSVGSATNPYMIRQLSYKPENLRPIAKVASSPLILFVRSGLPGDLNKLLEYASTPKGQLSFGNSGAGSSPNLAAALFAKENGLKVTHVNYRGTSAAMNDLLSGQLDGYFDTAQAMRYVETGKIHPIAVASSKRIELAPDVPTFAELGKKNIEAESWWGIFVQKNTSEDFVSKINESLKSIVQSDEVKQQAKEMGAIADYKDEAQFKKFFVNEGNRWGAIIKEEKLTSE